ncbi:hypothetical protein FKW77_003960 [Venturia effusa]|uniref:Uncharacterized protein n=1 Tax=Venturia effusa TaxID=50376 RepID=A0A517L925_9PEZI|nr:hypothetical protein FKW77_003960 [Venturia effusa]
MARIWNAGPRRAAQQVQRSTSSDQDTEPISSTDSSTNSSEEVSSSTSLSTTLGASYKDASAHKSIDQDPCSKQSTKKDFASSPHPISSVDRQRPVWGRVRKPTDLANQADWSCPLHRKEKMAYMFWKFASQDSIDELLSHSAKENLTRPRREVKLVMNRLLGYDFMYDSSEESEDEDEDEDEVSLEEIEGDETDFDCTEGAQDGTSSHGKPCPLLAEAPSVRKRTADHVQKTKIVDTKHSSKRTSRESEPRKPSKGSQKEVSSKSKVGKPQHDKRTSPAKWKTQTDKRTSPDKRKTQTDVPRCSRPPKRARTSLDPAKLAKELAETWRAEQAPIASEVKETRVAVCIVGQRGSKSVKYKVQWAETEDETEDYSFPDSWVDQGDAVITAAMVRQWET